MKTKLLLALFIVAIVSFALPVTAEEQQEDPVFMRVRRTLVESLGVDPAVVTLDSSLTSLGMNESNKDDVERDLEVQFGILIPDDEFERMSKVFEVVRFFREKLSQ